MSSDTSSEIRHPVEYRVSSTARSRSFQKASRSGQASRLGISISLAISSSKRNEGSLFSVRRLRISANGLAGTRLRFSM